MKKTFIQKLASVTVLSVLGIASFGTGAVQAYKAVTSSPSVVAYVIEAVTPSQASALTSSGGQIVVETADITLANDASTKTLGSMFEIIKFLPTMALIAGGMFVLGKVMGILPSGGGGGPSR